MIAKIATEIRISKRENPLEFRNMGRNLNVAFLSVLFPNHFGFNLTNDILDLIVDHS